MQLINGGITIRRDKALLIRLPSSSYLHHRTNENKETPTTNYRSLFLYQNLYSPKNSCEKMW